MLLYKRLIVHVFLYFIKILLFPSLNKQTYIHTRITGWFLRRFWFRGGWFGFRRWGRGSFTFRWRCFTFRGLLRPSAFGEEFTETFRRKRNIATYINTTLFSLFGLNKTLTLLVYQCCGDLCHLLIFNLYNSFISFISAKDGYHRKRDEVCDEFCVLGHCLPCKHIPLGGCEE